MYFAQFPKPQPLGIAHKQGHFLMQSKQQLQTLAYHDYKIPIDSRATDFSVLEVHEF